MSSAPPTTVLARYPQIRPESFSPLGGAGGFSGASIWRLTKGAEAWCLKAWPTTVKSSDQLGQIHRWMEQVRTAGLQYVPNVARTTDGATFLESGGRFWDLTEWMPGRADFLTHPTTARIETACVALAQLHLVWKDSSRIIAEPSSIQRRVAAAAAWQNLIADGWTPRFGSMAGDPVAEIASAAWQILPGLVPAVRPALAAWVGRSVPLHPCLCDIWHDHVLFTGDDVTGIIDYGAMRIDHPATDLARLLGDMAGQDHSLYDAGLTAYARVALLTDGDVALVRALDRTGTILSAANWLVRLYRDRQLFEDRARVAVRLGSIVSRLTGPGDFDPGRLC